MNKSLHILLVPKKEISRVMFLKSSGGFIRCRVQMLSTGLLEERLKEDGKTAFAELEISGDMEAVDSIALVRKELSRSGNQDETELKSAGKSRRLELVGKSC